MAWPTPSEVKAQLRMFARWPELLIHDRMTAEAVACPAAMFSPIVPPR